MSGRGGGGENEDRGSPSAPSPSFPGPEGPLPTGKWATVPGWKLRALGSLVGRPYSVGPGSGQPPSLLGPCPLHSCSSTAAPTPDPGRVGVGKGSREGCSQPRVQPLLRPSASAVGPDLTPAGPRQVPPGRQQVEAGRSESPAPLLSRHACESKILFLNLV